MKTYKVYFDRQAEEDLMAIYTYIANHDSILHADKIYIAVKKACERLKSFPLRDNVPPELQKIGVEEYREIRIRPYRILYSIEAADVFVHCILDGRRDMQSMLQDRLLGPIL